MQKICRYCNKNFYIKYDRSKYATNKQKYHIYCSKQCKYKGYGIGKYEQRECPVCKTKFKIWKSIKKRFCSSNCSYKARGLELVKRIVKKRYVSYGRYAEWRKRKCIICNIPFIASKRTSKYCSKKCCDIHKKTTQLGKKNPSYKNGSSYNKKSWRGDDWETIREQVYARDNYICVKCGIRCIGKRDANKKNSHKTIQCHHIEDYKINKNNNLDNLITICLRCHLKEHLKKKK